MTGEAQAQRTNAMIAAIAGSKTRPASFRDWGALMKPFNLLILRFTLRLLQELREPQESASACA